MRQSEPRKFWPAKSRSWQIGLVSLKDSRLIDTKVADSILMFGWLVDRNIAPHIKVIDKAARTDGTWSCADFEGDAKSNQSICPEVRP